MTVQLNNIVNSVHFVSGKMFVRGIAAGSVKG
ncbi:hypothetical protein X738_24825 [Mesorhizobium sp. LNHC209A00]|nr:hypothetical protein X738_24825 [Mesorhizobium sp. LNHC209A00]